MCEESRQQFRKVVYPTKNKSWYETAFKALDICVRREAQTHIRQKILMVLQRTVTVLLGTETRYHKVS